MAGQKKQCDDDLNNIVNISIKEQSKIEKLNEIADEIEAISLEEQRITTIRQVASKVIDATNNRGIIINLVRGNIKAGDIDYERFMEHIPTSQYQFAINLYYYCMADQERWKDIEKVSAGYDECSSSYIQGRVDELHDK